MPTTIHDIITEMQSFLPISKEDIERAKASSITDKNNPEFKGLVRSWCNGDYDEDPDILVNQLKTLLNE